MTGETGMDGARTSIATHDGDAADPWTKTRKTSMSGLSRTLTRARRCHVQNLYSAMVADDGEQPYLVFFDICPFPLVVSYSEPIPPAKNAIVDNGICTAQKGVWLLLAGPSDSSEKIKTAELIRSGVAG